jgi:CheY-like chemotaxis protein
VEVRVRKVLMGDFGALIRAGFEEILRDEHVQIVQVNGHDLVEQLVCAAPDVVILDLNRPGTMELVQQITRDFPALQVIACSATFPTMRVYPPFHRGESYESELDPELFTRVVGTT